ncbi:MAG: hypothetical protein FWF68_04360 [Spirochaetes bacterium]|nr:hypothetical protein [Brevinematales bacterium]MCL1958813.1 hypothetical protein [Spirochaetota bacterium]
MAQGTVGLRFNIDTSQAKTQVEDLSKTISTLNDEIRKATEEATKTGDWTSVAKLYESLNNVTTARGSIMQQAKQVQGDQARENMKNGGIFGGQNAWIIQTALNQLSRTIITTIESGFKAAQQRASGDYAGAAVTETRTEGELWGQGIGIGAGLLLNLIPGVGTALSAILTPTFAEFGKLIGGKDARENALAGIVTSGLTDSNAGRIPEYYTYKAAVAGAMGDNKIDSDELRTLITVLRNLADVLGKGDLFNGKTNEDINIWITKDF